MPYCRECGAELTAQAKFCKNCGVKCTPRREEPAACPNCGAVPSPGAKFCKKCGQRLENPVNSATPVIEIDAPPGAEITISDIPPEEIRTSQPKTASKKAGVRGRQTAAKNVAAKSKAAAQIVKEAVRVFTSEAPASAGESVLSDWK